MLSYVCSLKTLRFLGLGQSCDSPADGRFTVLSLYFVVIKPQSCAACVIILLPCVGGCCPRQHMIFLCSLYFNCYGLRAWMSTTLSYRFYVPTDKSCLGYSFF